MTFYLYRKKHNITNLNYLGYTKNCPFDYSGSGKYWKSHLAVYGDNVTTEILYVTENIEDISALGRYYSEIWDIVRSDEWANLQIESGGNPIISENTKKKMSISHSGKKFTEEHKQKISEALKGIVRPSRPHKQETKDKIGQAHKGKVTSEETKQKLRQSKLGRVLSEKHRQRMREGQLRRRSREKSTNAQHVV